MGWILFYLKIKLVAELLQHSAGAGAAAGVEQQLGPGVPQLVQDLLHLLGIGELFCHVVIHSNRIFLLRERAGVPTPAQTKIHTGAALRAFGGRYAPSIPQKQENEP